ncbi:MAG: LCP family protein [Tepidiforma sp.]|uniref:LCP family protein n=1 Tax=Tepidiforma sp. TaxID=2682230 RepID=UPI002635A115|nr:LCP family protein [Tepidiforma sp.]MCX7617941.1 LCP family protein [Tepidiforma sp.]
MTRRRGAVAGIVIGFCAAVYAAVFVLGRVDQYLFPANEVAVPSVPAFVPGTDIGVNVSLPGVSAPGPKPWTPDARLNILVLGIDKRPGQPEDGSYRSDTMFVASIDKHAGRLELLAIPRDYWAEIPYGNTPGVWAENKINAAYSYGQFYKYPGGGPAAAVAAVQHNLNITIHHYVVIDWEGFVRLIDALGGIDIDVPETISDFGTDVLEVFPNNTVQAGRQHMDGKQALGYSRVRVDGDLKRIERQQLVIRAVADKAVSLGYITRIPELWSAYRDAFRTDIDNALIPGYALMARSIDLGNIQTFSLGKAMYGGVSEDGQLILLPNRDQMYAVIDEFLADPQARDEAPKVALVVPPGGQAAGKAAVAHLETYGIPPAWVTVVAGDGTGTPGVYDVTGKPYTAGKLTGLFDLKMQNPDGSEPPGFDVVIRLGEGTALKTPG